MWNHICSPSGADKIIFFRAGNLQITKSTFRYPAQCWSEERNLTWLLVTLRSVTFILDPLVSVLNRGDCSPDYKQISFLSHALIGPSNLNST